MKPIKIVVIIFVLLSFSSCELIGDIFQAGVGVGIFIAVAVLVGVLFLFGKIFGRK